MVTRLIQAEKYGTPVGQSLRVLAQENRDMRMSEAEKKAAALPPKLTVPMILFFLPVLFAVIITPAAIQVAEHPVAQPLGKAPAACPRGRSARSTREHSIDMQGAAALAFQAALGKFLLRAASSSVRL